MTHAAPLAPLPFDGPAGTALLTYLDATTGERTSLSAAELGGWAARTASLLRDGCGLGSGSSAAVMLPPHWQTAAVLLGAWSAGVAVSFRPWATAGLAPADHTGLDAVFVSRQRADSWLETVPEAPHRFVLGLAPNAAPMDEVPEGYRDFVTEAGGLSTAPPDYLSIGGGDAASADGTSHRQWGELARGVAESKGLRAGDRVLIDTTATEEPAIWLLAPLAAGASIVLCAGFDDAGRRAVADAEGVTRSL